MGFFDMIQNGDVGGLLGTVGQGLADRRGLLYGIAANGFAGANEGRQSDQNALLLKQKQQERELKRQALLAYAQANGIDPGLAQDEDTLKMQIAAKQHEEMLKHQAAQEATANAHWGADYKLREQSANKPQLIGTPDTGYTWASPGQELPDAFTTPAGTKEQRSIAVRQAEIEKRGLDPKDPRNQAYILTGTLPKETQSAMTAGDKKQLWASEDELPSYQESLEKLNRAKELNNQTFTGAGAGKLGTLGTSGIPGTGFIDQGKAKATKEFGILMDEAAIAKMSEQLKGATTDREMDSFKTLMSDPTTPPDIRAKLIDWAAQRIERKRGIALDRIRQIGGDEYYQRNYERINGGGVPPSQDQGAFGGGSSAPQAGRSQPLQSGTYNWAPGKGTVRAQ